MVGEIRDHETLEIALNAAMTGHLVLSTLHTNSAAAALPRMLDMGAEPFLIASTANVIVAQRLVRRLCGECRRTFTLEEKQLVSLGKLFDMKRLLETLRAAPETEKILASAKSWSDVAFYQPVGCEQCGSEGYRGRAGIYEVLEMTEEIRKLVTKQASTEEIEELARTDNGMLTMVEDGFSKAVQGFTSIEEILRVTKE
jgi:type II secretory ATPase GspE/PulE/Tfp pilus assembly ATPase PilB-like protein